MCPFVRSPFADSRLVPTTGHGGYLGQLAAPVARVLLVSLPALLGSDVGAQQPPGSSPELITDRPDQTESATVVPYGTVQVETGWLWTEDEEGGLELSTEERLGTLVRLGVARRVELRLGWVGEVDEELRLRGRPTGRVSGVGDAELGAKIGLADERGARPQAALLVGVGLPVGDGEITSDRYDPSFRFSLAHTLTEHVSFGYNLGMTWSSVPGEGPPGVRETLSFVNYTAALGFGLSKRWGAFVEVFGDLPVDAPGGDAHSVDGGVTYLVRNNLQLDVSGGIGLSGSAPDQILSVGLSVRLPR